MFYKAILLVLLLTPQLLAEVNENNNPVLRGTYFIDSDEGRPILWLEVTGDVKHLIKFDRAFRRSFNAEWERDSIQVKRHKHTIEQIKETGFLKIGVMGTLDSPLNDVGKRLKVFLDNKTWDGDFILENPIPTTRKETYVQN